VDLGGADLREANLCEANLCEANLRLALLNEANLGRASFRQADFHYAVLSETLFGATDLSNVKGLDACQHRGRVPLIIGLLPFPAPFLSPFSEVVAFLTYSLSSCRRS
jgi:hypothetical protein